VRRRASPTKTAKRAPEATATPAPAALTFGSNRYVSPCSVLPMDAAERIYGPMNPLGYVRQEFYDRSMTEAEFKRETGTVTGNVRTACDYVRRRPRTLSPSHFRSTPPASARPAMISTASPRMRRAAAAPATSASRATASPAAATPTSPSVSRPRATR
jgi:hypothetical protein